MNLTERDQQFIWHPFTPQKNMQPSLAIVKGAESLLIDESGKQYIDAISSWWVTLHGHAHPYIAEKLYQQALQLEQVIFAGFTHQPAVDLAERLLGILPGNFARIFYSDNGSTSTEVALKMAIQYWWNLEDPAKNPIPGEPATRRIKILAFKDSYHGDTFGAMSVSDRSVFTLAFHELLFEVIFIDTPSADNLANIRQIILENSSQIAAFIYEPLVQGAGGMKMYEPLFMDELIGFVKQQDILCIADEVMTGFGRTGKLFASAYMDHKPDIICLSKGLTGGTMALGVTACTEKIYAAFVNDDKRKTFFHGHSFTANPLACAAALASLDLLLTQDCSDRITRISGAMNKFKKILEQKNNLRNIRNLGTILAFEINMGKDEYLNEISAELTRKSLDRGVYMRPLGNTVYLMPPYCITNAELEKVFEVLLEITET